MPPRLAKIIFSDIQSVTLNYHTPRRMYSIALKNGSLIIWECGKMSMENVEIFS